MWTAPSSVPELLPHVVAGAEQAGFTGMLVVLARTAEARRQHQELTRDWTSIHEVTGLLIAVLCPDPPPLVVRNGFGTIDEDAVNEFAQVNDLGLWNLGGDAMQFAREIVESVNEAHAWGNPRGRSTPALPRSPGEMHDAWTRATSACAAYFGIAEADLPAVLMLSFAERAAVLVRLRPRSTLSVYDLCKQIAGDLGFTQRTYHLGQRLRELRRTESRLQHETRAVDLGLCRATLEWLDAPLADRLTGEGLAEQFTGLDKHLRIVADNDPELVESWRTAVAALAETGTTGDAFRYLFAIFRHVSDTRDEHHWRSLHAKVLKIVKILTDCLPMWIDWHRRADDPIAEAVTSLHNRIREAEIDLARASAELAATHQRIAETRAELDRSEAAAHAEPGLAAATEATARRLLGNTRTVPIAGRAGLADFAVRTVHPVGDEPERPAFRNVIFGTVHGNVVQAREIRYPGLAGLVRRLFGRS